VTTSAFIVAQTIANRYTDLSEVEAVTLAGSQTSGVADPGSDIDLYVYVTEDIAIDERIRIASTDSDKPEVGNQFWEPGDEWVDSPSGIQVDVMFRRKEWIEEQLDRVLKHHQASVGYSTCFWHNVVNAKALFDRTGWYAQLQEFTRQPYPEELRRAIVAKNYPILRNTHSSYLYQLRCAISRNDQVSVNHRIAALLASYFDIVFAINRLPHPGEKRLVEFVTTRCKQIPVGFAEQVGNLVSGAGDILEDVNELMDGLDGLLIAENLL